MRRIFVIFTKLPLSAMLIVRGITRPRCFSCGDQNHTSNRIYRYGWRTWLVIFHTAFYCEKCAEQQPWYNAAEEQIKRDGEIAMFNVFAMDGDYMIIHRGAYWKWFCC